MKIFLEVDGSATSWASRKKGKIQLNPCFPRRSQRNSTVWCPTPTAIARCARPSRVPPRQAPPRQGAGPGRESDFRCSSRHWRALQAVSSGHVKTLNHMVVTFIDGESPEIYACTSVCALLCFLCAVVRHHRNNSPGIFSVLHLSSLRPTVCPALSALQTPLAQDHHHSSSYEGAPPRRSLHHHGGP